MQSQSDNEAPIPMQAELEQIGDEFVAMQAGEVMRERVSRLKDRLNALCPLDVH